MSNSLGGRRGLNIHLSCGLSEDGIAAERRSRERGGRIIRENAFRLSGFQPLYEEQGHVPITIISFWGSANAAY